MDFPRHCANPAEMQALGRALAVDLGPGAVVALDGDLGAGKTELVKGLATGLDFGGPVTSPTFTLLHEYRGGRVPFFHFDLYRVEHAEELLDLGWDELIEEGVLAVEWASRLPALLPEEALRLTVEILPEGGRRVHQSGELSAES